MPVKRRRSWACVLLITVLWPFQGIAANGDDARLTADIVGVWFSHFSWTDPNNSNNWLEAHGRDEYGADGLLQGTTAYTNPDGDSHLEFRAKWKIEHGHLIVEVLEAKGGFLEAGMITRDKIMSLQGSTMKLLAEDGNELTLSRGE